MDENLIHDRICATSVELVDSHDVHGRTGDGFSGSTESEKAIFALSHRGRTADGHRTRRLVGIAFVHECNRHAATAHSLQERLGIRPARRGDEHTGDALFVEEVEMAVLPICGSGGVAHDHGVALSGELLFGARCDLGEERVPCVEDDETNDVAARRPQP
jgi:hypothetical protein